MSDATALAPSQHADETLARLNLPGRFERLPMTGYQKRLFGVIATAWLADQVDVALLTFLLGSITVEFHLTPVQIGVLASMTFLGQLVGNILAGASSDLLGRKMTFQWTMVVWGLASFLAATSWSAGALMFFRFLIGVGVGGEAPVAQAMVSEFVPAKSRARYVAIMEGFWAVGFVLSGVISYYVLPIAGWRWVFVVVGVFAAFVFVVRRMLPESPRWLGDKRKYAQADAVMTEIETEVAKRVGPLPPPRPYRYETQQHGNPFVTLFQGVYLRRTIMAFGLWFFALLGYYGLTSWLAVLLTEHGFSIMKSVGFVTLITTGGIPGFIVASILLESIGRKLTTGLFLIMSAVMAYLYGHAGDTTTLFIAGFIMQFFTFGMWSCLYAYTPELYPTSARSTGAGCASAAGRVGAITGPIVVGYIVQSIGQPGVFTLGAASFVLAAAMVLILGVETRGKVLEEISV
jgi:putative MFS transporter